ncbi:hypothetical protein OQA88_10151 [Cercophora sp. LCS_1]
MAPVGDQDTPTGDDSPFISENEAADEYTRAAIIKHAIANAPPAPFFMLNRNYRRHLTETLDRVSTGLGRPLTPVEAEHFVKHEAKRSRILSYSTPAVLAFAFFLERRGRHQFRLPIRSISDPHIFGNGFLPPRFNLYGPSANRAWHAVRFGSYWFLSWLTLGAAVHTWAVTSVGMDSMRDKVVVTAIEEIMKKKKQQTQPFPGQGPPPHSARRPFSPPPPPSLPPSSQAQAPPQDEEQGWGSESYSVTEQQPSSFGAEQEPSPSTQTTGSAWEKLRREAAKGSGASPRQEGQSRRPQTWEERRKAARRESQGVDSYTYSSSEEEKAVAKDQAQKEFDAMLERERHGSDK